VSTSTARQPESPHYENPVCEVSGCAQFTKDSKPYCTDHHDKHAYVAGLLGRIEERERAVTEWEKTAKPAPGYRWHNTRLPACPDFDSRTNGLVCGRCGWLSEDHER